MSRDLSPNPHQLRWFVRGWVLTVMWGSGFGFRLRAHRVEDRTYLVQTTNVTFTLRFRPDEWDRITRAAESLSSSRYDFMKRTIMGAATHHARKASR